MLAAGGTYTLTGRPYQRRAHVGTDDAAPANRLKRDAHRRHGLEQLLCTYALVHLTTEPDSIDEAVWNCRRNFPQPTDD